MSLSHPNFLIITNTSMDNKFLEYYPTTVDQEVLNESKYICEEFINTQCKGEISANQKRYFYFPFPDTSSLNENESDDEDRLFLFVTVTAQLTSFDKNFEGFYQDINDYLSDQCYRNCQLSVTGRNTITLFFNKYFKEVTFDEVDDIDNSSNFLDRNLVINDDSSVDESNPFGRDKPQDEGGGLESLRKDEMKNNKSDSEEDNRFHPFIPRRDEESFPRESRHIKEWQRFKTKICVGLSLLSLIMFVLFFVAVKIFTKEDDI